MKTSKYLTLTLEELISSIEFECKTCHMRLSLGPDIKKPAASIFCICDTDGRKKLVDVQRNVATVEVQTIFDAIENLRKFKPTDDDVEIRLRIELPVGI